MANNPYAGAFDDVVNTDSTAQQQPIKTVAAPVNDNPYAGVFDDIVSAKAKAEQQAANSTPVAPNSGMQTFWDSLTQFNRGFERLAEGGLQLIGKGISLIAPETGQNLQENVNQLHNEREKEYNAAWERNHGPLAYASDIAGQLGAATVALAGTAGSVPATMGGRIALSAAQGAGLGGLDYAKNDEERIQKMVAGGAIGAVTGFALEKVAQMFNPKAGEYSSSLQKLLTPKNAALQDTATRVKNELGDNAADEVLNAVKSAKEQGINLTPAQAIGGAELKNVENALSMPPQAKAKAASIIKGNEQKITSAINNTIDEMGGGAKESLQKIYDQIDNMNFSQKSIDQLMDNPDIIQYAKMMNTDNPDLANKAKAVWGTIQDKLAKNGDDALNTANKAFEQLQIKQSYVEKLKNLNFEEGTGAKTAPAFKDVNNALFGTESKVNQFLDDVAKTGGNVDKAESLIKLAKQMDVDTLKNIQGEASLKGVKVRHGIMHAINKKIEHLSTTRYQNALIDMMMSGNKWADEVSGVLKGDKPTPEKLKGFWDLIDKVASTIDDKKSYIQGAASLAGARNSTSP